VVCVPRFKEDDEDVGPATKLSEELKAMGLTPRSAQAMLNSWRSMGVTDTKNLNKVVAKQAIRPITGLLIQALLDGATCAISFYLADAISDTFTFPGKILVLAATYFLAIYYLIQSVFEVGAIAIIIVGALKYRTNAAALYEAVQQLAGPQSNFSVVNQAELAVNSVKVMQALDRAMDVLKDEFRSGSDANTMENLSAYLTLQRAQQVFGFKPEKYGLSEREAADIAMVFSRYDVNDDGKLQCSELRSLCSRLGQDLSGPEVEQAVRMLDKSNSGVVEFNAFVEWWTRRR
jgi:hypothetical protein